MKLTPFVLAGALLLGSTWAQAQTTPAKPAPKPAAKPAAQPAAKAPAKPAADGKTLQMGGSGTSGGPILTRDELRACFKDEEAIRNRLTEHEAARAPLDQDKASITAEQKTLAELRVPVDEAKKKAEDFRARLKAYGARVESWNQRVTAHNDEKRQGPQWERQGKELAAERTAIEKERADFEVEKNTLQASSDEAVRNFNNKAQALEVRINDWNQRNGKWNEASAAIESDRKAWVAACADRRYREEDEQAIRRGK